MLPLFAKLANEVFCQIAEGSFSDVSKPIFASKDAFAAAFGPLNLTKEVQEVALKSVREGRGVVVVDPGQFLANFRQNFARFRLCRRRSLQLNTRFAAFFKIYQII